MNEILRIDNLTVAFGDGPEESVAVKGVSLGLAPGETLALVGESGCGKTVLCKSILHILCSRGRIKKGNIFLKGRDITHASEKEMNACRGRDAAMVFQDPMTSLDPAFGVGEQIAESMRIHGGISRKEAREKAVELLELLHIPGGAESYSRKPYQFSGGQRQRIAIAVAVAAGPKLLLADEPTTALDEETQGEILTMLRDVCRSMGMAMIFITHDLSLVEEMASRVAVMKNGQILETGPVEQVFAHPSHEYTKKLLGYLDYGRDRGHNHRGGSVPGDVILSVEGLTKAYRSGRKAAAAVLENFSMEIRAGEVVGLVGRSGCGKTTLARCIMGLEKPDAGSIRMAEGAEVQMIFQDTGFAFNDKMTVEEIIAEPLVIRGGFSRSEIRDKVSEAMKAVELDPELRRRHPYRLSGGQRQRAAIARALICEPDLIVADEPLTGLDVTAQAQIVHLLRELSASRRLAVLFIAHDLPMVNHVSHRVIRMI